MFNVKLLGERIKKIRDKKSQDVFAGEIGISRGALSYYENGEREPDAKIIYKICKIGNVSVDYLLGFTDNPTIDLDLRAICDYTGLNEKAIDILHTHYEGEYEEQAKIRNYLIESGYFERLIILLTLLLESSKQYIVLNSLENDKKSDELHQELYQNKLQCDVDRYNLIKFVEKLSDLFDQREQVQNNGKHNPSEE